MIKNKNVKNENTLTDHPKNGDPKNDYLNTNEIQRDTMKDNDSADHIVLTGMFPDRKSTEKAYDLMNERGYTRDDINLVMSKATHNKYFSNDKEETELGNKAAEGSGAGSAIGGTIGAIAGIIAAIGTSIVIPGLGLVVAGPIAAGLAGAGAGGLAGGIIGALVGWGIPEDRAKIYESGIKNGHIFMGVRPKNDDDAKQIERTWHENDAREIHR
jgi:hypothetical protein